MSQYTAIIDIGSSKIICLVCGTAQGEMMVVHGAGIKEYDGYRHGAFENEQAFCDAVVDAMSMAERESKHRIRDISVGVPGPFMRLHLQEGTVELDGKRVSYDDIDAIMTHSLAFEKPEGFELMHSTPIGFWVDGVYRADMPVGIAARQVSATVSHAMVDVHFKALLAAALNRYGLHSDMFIGVPLSEAVFVIPAEERLRGAVLLDVGATHTDVSFVQGNALLALRTIEVGGEHFTNDLAYGLCTQRAIAEGIKRRYVYALDYQDSIDTIRIPGGGTLRVEHAAIQYIIEARTKELADLILQAMLEMGIELDTSLPIYLTGGGISLMRGSCEFLERAIGIPIQVRMPWMPRLSSPNYASGYSVMEFVIRAQEGDEAGVLQGVSAKSKLIRKLRDFFIK